MYGEKYLELNEIGLPRTEALLFVTKSHYYLSRFEEATHFGQQALSSASDIAPEDHTNWSDVRNGTLKRVTNDVGNSTYRGVSRKDWCGTVGQIHLVLGFTALCQGCFRKSIHHLSSVLRMSRCADEPCLSLEAYAGLSQVFTLLGDFERGLQLAQKGVSISSSFQICDLRTSFTRLALLHLVLPLRKLQHLNIALTLCKVSGLLKFCRIESFTVYSLFHSYELTLANKDHRYRSPNPNEHQKLLLGPFLSFTNCFRM